MNKEVRGSLLFKIKVIQVVFIKVKDGIRTVDVCLASTKKSAAD